MLCYVCYVFLYLKIVGLRTSCNSVREKNSKYTEIPFHASHMYYGKLQKKYLSYTGQGERAILNLCSILFAKSGIHCRHFSL